MNRKYIPQFVTTIAKGAAYRLYRFSDKVLKPPFDKYDFETFEVFKRVLKKDSNCIDVGAHKGDVLSKIIKNAPAGTHFAFEPIPYLFDRLKKIFKNRVALYNYALSDAEGEATFTVYKNRPAVSGLKDTMFDDKEYKKETITVQVKKLDDMIPADMPVSLLKIDVEGAELQVLKGASKLIESYKPVVLFEFGWAGSRFYDVTPEEMFDFFTERGMLLSSLEYFLSKKPALDKSDFCSHFHKGYNYFFIAYDEAKHVA